MNFVPWFYYSKSFCDTLPISELYDWECSFLEKSQNCQMFKNHNHFIMRVCMRGFFRANISQWVKTFLKSQLISIVQTIVYSQKTIVLSQETIFRIPWTMGTTVESSEDIVYNP